MKWTAVFLAVAILACGCMPAPADPMVEGAKLVGQLRAAAGGINLDKLSTYHASGKRVRDGRINGVFESWGDFRTAAFIQSETFEGVTTKGGFSGAVAWGLGPDGKVGIESNPERLAWSRLGAYVNTQGYLFPDRFRAMYEFRGKQQADGQTFDVVKVTPEGTASVELWLDPKTHLMQSLIARNGTTTFVGQVKEYRTIDGIKVMWRGLQTMTAGAETHTETAELDAFVFEPIPPERFAPPK